jgi:hypothetical protein
MSKYVLKNDHPLIPREQKFSIDRKLLTVHSEDRDINKWPSANHFELQLPQTYTNVETLALVEYNFPTYYYTFSNQNQNTIITVYMDILDSWGPTHPRLKVRIEPGFYSPTQLATELENKLNLEVQKLDPTTANYNNFRVYYDEVRQRLLFGNTVDPFEIIYNTPESYDSEPCYACPPSAQTGQPISDPKNLKWCQTSKWCQYTNWGLAYNLGFVKCQNGNCYPSAPTNTSAATAVVGDQKVYYVNSSATSQGTTWLPVGTGNTGHVLIPPNPPSLNGDTAMYMEIDKYNYADEMQPYSENTNNGRNNDYNGIVNAAFAKIPILTKPTKIISNLEYQFGNEPQDTAEGMSSFFPPLDKLSKLKFKFRYHDGTLVNFGGQNFSFTIALYCYRDEIARSKSLRIPFLSPG